MGDIFSIWFGVNKEKIYWYIALGLILILVPLCFIREITSFSKWHILGDFAVLSTVVVLAIFSIMKINETSSSNISDLKLINNNWAKLIGMSVTMLEGVGVILPIKVNN